MEKACASLGVKRTVTDVLANGGSRKAQVSLCMSPAVTLYCEYDASTTKPPGTPGAASPLSGSDLVYIVSITMLFALLEIWIIYYYNLVKIKT